MKIGILGAGGIVPAHLNAANQLGFEIIHIADKKIENARSLADSYNIKEVSDNLFNVIKNPHINMIIIALPTYMHYTMQIACAENGKHALTEKPICRTVEDAEKVIAYFQSKNLKLAVGYQRRFSKARIKIREIIQSGELGFPITWVLAGYSARNDFYRGASNWMWDFEKGGGLVMDGSIHDFDFASWVLGQPIKMYAQSNQICENVTAPTQASAIVSFENNDIMTYSVAWQENITELSNGIERIIGPYGTIIPDSEYSFTYCKKDNSIEKISFEPNDMFKDQLSAFSLYIKENINDHRLTVGAEAINSLWISENIAKSGSQCNYYHRNG